MPSPRAVNRIGPHAEIFFERHNFDRSQILRAERKSERHQMAKMGRPTREPTAEDRRKVKELLAQKSPICDLAKMFGCSEPTFRKHFSAEIFSERASRNLKGPARKVSDAMRDKVKRYVGCKMPLRHIAYALGYERDDEFDAFKNDFAHEIEIGAAVYRAMVIDQLHVQMAGGALGATNKLESLTQASDGDEEPQVRSAGYVSKKAVAKADADMAVAGGGKFAPRVAPRLAASGGKRVED